jgi:hypothetical protein
MAINRSSGKKGTHSRISSLAGGIICLTLSATGFYVVFFGNELSGGIPFISEYANQMIGKVFIFGGALFTGWLAIIAFKELIEGGKNKKQK